MFNPLEPSPLILLKNPLINLPEARSQVVRSNIYGWDNDGVKISKSIISVNGKTAEMQPKQQ
jgi:hypothetical protein